MDWLLAAWSLKASATSMTLPSTNLLCDALHRASPDAERLSHLQNTHTLREQPSHLPFGRAVYLRAAELYPLSPPPTTTVRTVHGRAGRWRQWTRNLSRGWSARLAGREHVPTSTAAAERT